jgi:hypothetical protein
LYPRLTARENIAYFGELQGLSGPALGRRVTELVSALGLDEQADRRVEGFSRGERLKVALGRALVHAPQHLVLDEPTNGLDVASAHNAPESFVAAAPPFFGRLCLGLIPLALMGAALQLLVSTRCRSTKEAQSWLMMVVFVPMVAGMGVVFFPGWTDRWWMIAPIVGQQVMIAGGLGGDGVSLLESLTLAGTTAACTIAMLFVGSAGLNQDDVLAD